MNFSKLKNATPAAAPAPAPVEAKPSPEAVPAPAPAGGALSVFSSQPVGAALLAATEGEGRPRALFPTIQVTGGETGGAFKPVGDDAVAKTLPSGTRPLIGVFLGYRYEITAWPTQRSNTPPPAGTEVEVTKPVWAAAVPCVSAADAQLLEDACAAYQFTKRDERSAKFDYATAGIGHIRPTFQALIYLPAIPRVQPEAVVVVQPPALLDSWRDSAAGLRKFVDKATGALPQFPTFVGVKTRKIETAVPFPTHALTFDVAADADGKMAWEAFCKWREAVTADPAKMQELNDWMMGADRAMTDDHRERMRKAAALRQRR